LVFATDPSRQNRSQHFMTTAHSFLHIILPSYANQFAKFRVLPWENRQNSASQRCLPHIVNLVLTTGDCRSGIFFNRKGYLPHAKPTVSRDF